MLPKCHEDSPVRRSRRVRSVFGNFFGRDFVLHSGSWNSVTSIDHQPLMLRDIMLHTNSPSSLAMGKKIKYVSRVFKDQRWQTSTWGHMWVLWRHLFKADSPSYPVKGDNEEFAANIIARRSSPVPPTKQMHVLSSRVTSKSPNLWNRQLRIVSNKTIIMISAAYSTVN